MTPAKYEIRVKPGGLYCLIIHGAIKFDDLTFDEAISKISEAEAAEEKPVIEVEAVVENADEPEEQKAEPSEEKTEE